MNDRRLKGRGAGGFKFEESWLLWDDCKEAVLEVWTKGGQGSPGLSRVRDQIQGCGVDLQAQIQGCGVLQRLNLKQRRLNDYKRSWKC